MRTNLGSRITNERKVWNTDESLCITDAALCNTHDSVCDTDESVYVLRLLEFVLQRRISCKGMREQQLVTCEWDRSDSGLVVRIGIGIFCFFIDSSSLHLRLRSKDSKGCRLVHVSISICVGPPLTLKKIEVHRYCTLKV